MLPFFEILINSLEVWSYVNYPDFLLNSREQYWLRVMLNFWTSWAIKEFSRTFVLMTVTRKNIAPPSFEARGIILCRSSTDFWKKQGNKYWLTGSVRWDIFFQDPINQGHEFKRHLKKVKTWDFVALKIEEVLSVFSKSFGCSSNFKINFTLR